MSLKAETRLVVPIEKPRRNLWRRIRQRPEVILSPLVLVVFLVIWEWVSTSGLVSPVILPAPPKVFRGILTLVKASWFPQHLWTTTIETVLGFCIAGASAFTMAVFLHQVPLLRRVIYPYVVTFQVMPMIVLAPIFVVWFGFGITSKVVVSVTTAFFVVLVNSLAGLAAVPENSLLLMRSMVATRRQVLFKLTIPTSLPYVFAGLKTAATLALIGSLVGEFVTAEKGLGRLLTQFSFALKQDLVFATVIWVGVLGLALYGIVSFLEKKLVWWR
ncbi:MAG TPA: ABC transporter permease [Actinomycetota bacterium]|jgi:NitT/TauT family transport system permease protein